MHVNEKILEEVRLSLRQEYKVSFRESDWAPFRKSLPIDDNGLPNLSKFEQRQKKSIAMIKQILKGNGKDSMAQFLVSLAIIEPRIQDVEPWVRDHVAHAINTFLVGAYILEKVAFPAPRHARFDYPFVWKLSGPIHDIGYPIEIARNIAGPFADKMDHILGRRRSRSPRLKPELFPQNLDRLCGDLDASDLIQGRLKDWHLNLDVKQYYNWLREKNMADHGVVSALVLLKVTDAFYNKENPDKKYEDIFGRYGLNYNQKNFDLDIVSASSAVFLHNIDLKYDGFSDKIDFNIAPLAFLLFLCDTFEEWDRYTKNRPVYPGDEFDIECCEDSISLSVPQQLEEKAFGALNKRLSGLVVKVNDEKAVS